MREAVIVSTARTPIGKAYRGGFNNLASPTLAGHAISAAVARAGIEPDRIEDCIMGAALVSYERAQRTYQAARRQIRTGVRNPPAPVYVNQLAFPAPKQW